MNVFGIDGSNKGLVEPGKDFVDDLVALAFEYADLGGHAGQPRVPGAHSVQQKPGGLRNDFHLL